MATVAAEVGSTANSYQILAKLAAGGMAEIFLARGASVAGVERYCVLKRILRERARDAQFVQMFVDEARLAAQLQHPNIASVYDIGMLGDSYFFTMEYVHGETIRSLLQRAQGLRRPIPLACVLTIIAGTASGLHHAHERNSNDGRPLGIVHRDVSPSNLMVSFEGNIKVVDFGVAKAADRAVETKSGTVKGKISYLSPEQCRGARVDRRSDLFSLGIVMWEMLTGVRLYRRESDFENMTAIVNELPQPPSYLRSEVPGEVDDIVLRLLAKSAGDRFQTAAEVVEAIENASMHARTILSTSAVSRLVRDLFGQRAEPWLELDGDTISCEPLTLAARPIPKTVECEPLDAVELGLASVLDLSSPNLAFEPDDRSDPPDIRTAMPPSAQPAQIEVPIVSPSADRVSVAMSMTPSAPVPAVEPTTQLSLAAVPDTSPPSTSTPLMPPTVPPARIAEPTASSMLSAHSVPSLLNTTQLGTSAPLPSTTVLNNSTPTASRIPWPLVVVIIIAVALGVIAVWFSMSPNEPSSKLRVASLPEASAGTVDANEAGEHERKAAGAFDASDTTEDAEVHIDST